MNHEENAPETTSEPQKTAPEKTGKSVKRARPARQAAKAIKKDAQKKIEGRRPACY